MSFWEQIYATISPRRACERLAWKQQLEMARNYDAGGYGRVNSRWSAFNESGERTDCYQRDTIRARARDLERNSDMANAIVSAFKRNVVGRGFSLQARTDNIALNGQINALWKDWCKRKNCDVTGAQSFVQMLRMAVGRKKIDGGILFLKRYMKGGLLPFRLQAIEVDELATDQMSPHGSGNRVVGGIEYNAYNHPMGYWISQYSLDGMVTTSPVYFPAKDVIFYFAKTRPSEVREVSDFAHTIGRIRDANEFINAVSIKERIAACLAVFIKRSPASVGGGIGRNIAQNNKGGVIDYAGKTLSPGLITEMNSGDEIQVVNPGGSGDDTAGFLKTQQRLMGAGMGISYEGVSRDMSESNYSSARQAAVEDGLTYDEERELLIECVMEEAYETFVISAVLAGILSIQDFWERKETYLLHTWVVTPKPWIDPAKEATANKIALATGQKTFQQTSAESGRDWKGVIDDMAEAMDYAREKGIDLGGLIYGSTAQAVPITPDEPEPKPAKRK